MLAIAQLQPATPTIRPDQADDIFHCVCVGGAQIGGAHSDDASVNASVQALIESGVAGSDITVETYRAGDVYDIAA